MGKTQWRDTEWIPHTHIDHNTDNNAIENLVILGKNIVKYGVPAAREWHGTKKGNEWHKEHYSKSLGLLHQQRITLNCVVCGEQFKCDACKTDAKYCSNLCKSRSRRKRGVDKEQRTCSICSNIYMVNRYSKGVTCSPKCSGKLRSDNYK